MSVYSPTALLGLRTAPSTTLVTGSLEQTDTQVIAFDHVIIDLANLSKPLVEILGDIVGDGLNSGIVTSMVLRFVIEFLGRVLYRIYRRQCPLHRNL